MGHGAAWTENDVLEAVLRADERQAKGKVERHIWLSDHVIIDGMVWAEMENMALLEEARVSFIYGRYLAALILACAFFEQTAADIAQSSPGCWGDDRKTCVQKGLPDELMTECDRLYKIRNAYCHRKTRSHQTRLSIRFRATKCHPDQIKLQDARDAMVAMYKLHRLTLQPISLA